MPVIFTCEQMDCMNPSYSTEVSSRSDKLIFFPSSFITKLVTTFDYRIQV